MLRRPYEKSWSVQRICTMIQKQTITFDSALQRPVGQWKIEDKSLLIDSLLRMYIPSIYAIQSKNENDNTVYDIIDGKQRLTIISSFLSDEWKLTKLQPIQVESTEEIYDISGKRFSELPKDVQEEINGYMLDFKLILLNEKDHKDNIVNEIFYRLNNGVAVSKEHLALVKAKPNVQDFAHRILTEHKLFTDIAHFPPSSLKKSGREMTVMQSILLVSGLEYKSFAAKDVEKVFADNDISEEILELTEQSFNDIVNTFTNHSKHASKINIPILSNILANTADENKAVIRESILKYFNTDMEKGDDYKKNCGASCTKKEKVKGRITALQNISEVKTSNVSTHRVV